MATQLAVVSLVPSLTETLIALGITPIGCTRFCEQPTIVHVGGTKDPDIDAIVAIRPDVVVMDREENRRDDADALAARGVDVFATHVTAVDDVVPMLADLRARLGLKPSPIRDPVATAVAPAPRSAFVAIWRRPWMTLNAHTYGSSLLASIGIANVFADHADAYPSVTLDEVCALAPELILLPSEPYPFRERHVRELTAAVPGADIRLIDGQDLFWWGARTTAARMRLGQALGGPVA